MTKMSVSRRRVARWFDRPGYRRYEAWESLSIYFKWVAWFGPIRIKGRW